MKFVYIAFAAFFCFAGQALAADAAIHFNADDGVYYVSVALQTSESATDVNFVVDSGAKYITVPLETLTNVEKTLVGTGEIYVGGAFGYSTSNYKVAKMTVGGCEFRDVQIVATIAVGKPFLGQTFLRQVEPYSIGNGKLAFTCPSAKVASSDQP